MGLLKLKVEELRHTISDQNLESLPDYEERIAINSADELIITELILDNILGDFKPEEIKENKRTYLDIPFGNGMMAESEIQSKCELPIGPKDYVCELNFGLVEVVYEWARGITFKDITQLTDILEGLIVQCITRLDETCREIRNAAKIIGDSSLYKKMENTRGLIKRDIVFAASLVSQLCLKEIFICFMII
ncbi:hypothetical protein G9A89_007417 [Geosiphon pyriformis]|nr:hypothetical protein G9A89_007417 [Geosiphon pyriformis]